MTTATENEFRVARVDAGPGGALAQAMREEIAEMYDGLDLDGPSMPKAGAEELGRREASSSSGERDGEAVCCGGIKRLTDEACEIKKMYVVPAARSHGVARTLLYELERMAAQLGYVVVRLDTGPKQLHARGSTSPRATSGSRTSTVIRRPRSGGEAVGGVGQRSAARDSARGAQTDERSFRGA